MKIIGHRGAAGYTLENTLASFQKAIKIGCDGTELDVHLTRDNIPVVIHDSTVDRVTSGSGIVSQMSLEEIKKLDCKDKQKIPTLQEVIDLCREKINLKIELKADVAVRQVAEALKQNNIVPGTSVLSFDKGTLKEIRKILPDLTLCYLFEEYSDDVWKLAEDLSLEFLGPKYSTVDQEVIDKSHSLGIKIYTWTVNEKKTGKKLETMGVDELVTDYPKVFI
ncbi:MAG: hypothetical protein A2826_01985 [Candidatus Doudnabacteria bacterium RIFCSPHIGHO2_01_FULL_43_23]|uniref:GP-PDE domain-containing protein n=1 Tax=Candidatus Doudnabacteria bacterium RIFCSPHIGHO2_01_FULL_43_23 TaxID=1817822 RepID=A0A1F5NUF7_9BACT|nr:MAG: hypothetical protein A2826_01985 [Candidatus Doudnabacteria bacterium RIFCSPHIGHO2_01_FULL_43_23]